MKYWYQDALKERQIDYWNFNACLRWKPYQIFATRTQACAKGLGLRRIRKLSDGLYYGVLHRTTRPKPRCPQHAEARVVQTSFA